MLNSCSFAPACDSIELIVGCAGGSETDKGFEAVAVYALVYERIYHAQSRYCAVIILLACVLCTKPGSRMLAKY